MERVMTVPEVADCLRQSVYTIRNWIKQGRLQARRVGRAYLIPQSAVEELIAPPPRAKLSTYESLKMMRELQEEVIALGIGPDTFRAAMDALEKRGMDAREERGRMTGGSGP